MGLLINHAVLPSPLVFLGNDDLAARLYARSSVDLAHPYKATPCRVWNGCRTEKGYGQIRLQQKGGPMRVHRLSHEIFIGPIPDGLDVLHRCDNPPCWEPSHLWAGTNDQNKADSVRKGRTNRHVPWARGENNVTAKLSWSDVDEINALILGGLSNVEIAPMFGVTHHAIKDIRCKKTWQHREGEEVLST